MSNLKEKYHGDLLKSAQYYSRELFAAAYIIRYMARLGVGVAVRRVGLGGLGVVEDEEEHSRFDLEVVRIKDGARLALIEVTGDNLKDDKARFLCEKVAKAAQMWPTERVWFIYIKDGRGKIQLRAFAPRMIMRFATVERWVQDEKPYYIIDFKRGYPMHVFAKVLAGVW